MWEFLGGKKEEATAAPIEPVASSEVKASQAESLAAEAAAEQSRERVNEKYTAILSQASKDGAVEPIIPDVHSDAERVGQVIDTTSQVNQLVELAQVKGLAHAVTVARKLNDLYVLDMTHDQFVDKWYEALKAKGLVQGE